MEIEEPYNVAQKSGNQYGVEPEDVSRELIRSGVPTLQDTVRPAPAG